MADLDPSQTILQCAQNDLNDLSNLKFAQSIISSAFAGTLTSTGSARGISEQELAREVLKPGDDINSYTASLQALEKYGTYFQHSEGNYFFDVQEKPNAKVEYRSLRIDQADALEFALNRWKNNVFNDSTATIYRDPLQTKTQLNQGDKNNIRFVLSPKRLGGEERMELYRGIENRNQVILVEPRPDEFNALENQDIVKWAQRAKAAMELQNTASDSERKRQYEKIAGEELRYIDDTFKKAGLYYISIHVSSDGNLIFEKEPVGNASSRQDLLGQLQQNIFPRQMFEEHIQKMVQDEQQRVYVLGKTVTDLRAMYKKTLGFPVLISDAILIDALKGVSRNKKIGLQNSRVRHCGTTPSFSSSEWNDVQVVEPFEDLGEQSLHGGTLPIFPAQEKSPIGERDAVSPTLPNAPNIAIQSLQTTNVNSLNLLRQEVAAKLAPFGDVKVVRVRYVIFFEGNKVELSTLPSALRGSMSGNGDIHLELDITKEGEYSKAQLEQLTEQLPNIRDAVYRAELRLLLQEEIVVGK